MSGNIIKVIFVNATLEEIKKLVIDRMDPNTYEQFIGEFNEGSVNFYAQSQTAGHLASLLQRTFDGPDFTYTSSIILGEMIVIRYVKNQGDIRSTAGTVNQAKALFN